MLRYAALVAFMAAAAVAKDAVDAEKASKYLQDMYGTPELLALQERLKLSKGPSKVYRQLDAPIYVVVVTEGNAEAQERVRSLVEAVANGGKLAAALPTLPHMREEELRIARKINPSVPDDVHLYGLENFYLHGFSALLGLYLAGPTDTEKPWRTQTPEFLDLLQLRDMCVHHYFQELANSAKNDAKCPYRNLIGKIWMYLKLKPDTRPKLESIPEFSDTKQWHLMLKDLLNTALLDADELPFFPVRQIGEWVDGLVIQDHAGSFKKWLRYQDIVEDQLTTKAHAAVVKEVVEELVPRDVPVVVVVDGIKARRLSRAIAQSIKGLSTQWEDIDLNTFDCDVLGKAEACAKKSDKGVSVRVEL